MLKGTAAGAVGLVAGLTPAAVPGRMSYNCVFTERGALRRSENQLFPGTEVEFLNISGIDHEEVAARSSILAAGAAGRGLRRRGDRAERREALDAWPIYADMAPRPRPCSGIYQLRRQRAQHVLQPKRAGWKRRRDCQGLPEYAVTTVGGEEMATPGPVSGAAGARGISSTSNFLTEERAPGGDWFWETFYADNDDVAHRGGGWRWPEPSANHPNTVEALEYVVSLTNDGLAPGIEMGGGASLVGLFVSDKLAMTPMRFRGRLPDQQRHGEGHVRRAVLAALEVAAAPAGRGGNWIFTGSPNADRMWEFLKFSIQVEQLLSQAGRYRPLMTTTPVRRSMAIAEAYEPTGPANWEVFYDTLDRPDTAPIPAPPEANAVTNIHTRFTGLALSGEMSPQEAMDQAQAELETLFARTRA